MPVLMTDEPDTITPATMFGADEMPVKDPWLEGHDHECPRCGSVCDCEPGSEFEPWRDTCTHDCGQ